MADLETAHDTFDHTGLTGVSGGVVPWALVPHTPNLHQVFATVGAANRGLVVPVTLPAGATITGVRLVVSAPSGNISVALYDASLSRVATSGSVACPSTGAQSVNFSGSYSAAAGRYYIGISFSDNTAQISYAATTVSAPIQAYYMESAHPLPATFVSAGLARIPVLVGLISGGWAP